MNYKNIFIKILLIGLKLLILLTLLIRLLGFSRESQHIHYRVLCVVHWFVILYNFTTALFVFSKNFDYSLCAAKLLEPTEVRVPTSLSHLRVADMLCQGHYR